MTTPVFPVDSVSVTGVRTAEVESVEIGMVTVGIPPAAFETLSTVTTFNVVISVKR